MNGENGDGVVDGETDRRRFSENDVMGRDDLIDRINANVRAIG